MLRYLAHNWELKLVSLASTILLWGFVVSREKAESVLPASVEFENLPNGLRVAGDTPAAVEVEIQGFRTQLARLSREALVARVNLSGGQEGANTILVLPEHLSTPPRIRILRISPARLQVTLEKLSP